MRPEPLPVVQQSPCIEQRCRACCHDTEMPLLVEDVERLAAHTGRGRDDFAMPDGAGGLRLRNRDGACVFLGPDGCTVYAARPAGCRLYPLVWDPDAAAAHLDEGCPYRAAFRPRPKDAAALRRLVDRLQRGSHHGDAGAAP